MVSIRAALAAFLSISHALALHLAKVISVDEYVMRRRTQPEDDFPLFGLDPASQKHIEYWGRRLTHRSLAVVGPCRPPGDAATFVCRAPPYPLFPLPEDHRNRLLQRPAPDVVRANIQQATKGELSTVDELVRKVNANLEDGSGLDDDEATLLATNFANPKAGLTVSIGCGPAHYSGWSEDMLVSQDEQRALLAGFLYIIDERTCAARRDAMIREAVYRLSAVEQTLQQCEAAVTGGTVLFRQRVERLAADVLVPEAEWLARYDEYVAALRAEMYALVPGGADRWERMRHKVEEIVSVAEEDIAGDIMCRTVRMDEPGFARFLSEQSDGIQREYPELHPLILPRVAYRRWKLLSSESQAAYMVESESV